MAAGAGSRSVAALMRAGRASLTRAGIDDVDTNLRVLMETAVGSRPLPPRWPPTPEYEVSEAVKAAFQLGVARRCGREPLQYIAREWDFDVLRGLEVARPVLIPRPETEELVALASDYAAGMMAGWSGMGITRRFRFLEVGCGAGGVTAALLRRHPDIVGTAIDVSPAAVALARRNCTKFGVADRVALAVADGTEWAPRVPAALSPLEVRQPDPPPPPQPSSSFSLAPQRGVPPGLVGIDMVVANLPYIPPWEMADLAPEVRDHEDPRALNGGDPAGLGVTLAVLRNIATSWWCRPAAPIFLETHSTHPALLAYLLAELPPKMVRSPAGGAGGAPPPPAYTDPDDQDINWLAARTRLSEDALRSLYDGAATLRDHFDFVSGYEDRDQVPRFAHLRRADPAMRITKDDAAEVGFAGLGLLLSL